LRRVGLEAGGGKSSGMQGIGTPAALAPMLSTGASPA